MKEVWLEIRKGGDFHALGEALQLSPVTARLLVNRDLTTPEEMKGFLTNGPIYDPALLKDCEKAAALLLEKIKAHKKIRIIGDYDIDGVTATYILLKGLHRLSAEADAAIPDRIRDGYGLNLNLVEAAHADGIDTVLTCDNGISAAEEILRGKELGMTMIVTDHHDIPFEDTAAGRMPLLPPADAVVNPKQADCSYPFPKICGAVVAWKLIRLLYRMAGIDEAEAEVFWDVAAFATIGDVMELSGENRTIVREGLTRLANTENIGLRALIDACGLNGKELSVYHVGFVLGPCINASGRLLHASLALELLMEEDPEKASELAERLRSLNEERKQMTQDGVEEALAMIEENDLLSRPVLIVFLPDCHESLAGIIAGRLKELTYRPTFVITRSGDLLKGSGRSVPEYSMYEELTKVKRDLLRFGGHPMAAGLSLTEEKLPQFIEDLETACALSVESLVPKLRFEMELPFSYVTEEQIRQIRLLAPFGTGNPEPLFATRGVSVLSAVILGKNRNVCRLKLMQESRVYNGIWFQDPEALLSVVEEKYGHDKREDLLRGRGEGILLSFIYYPEINEYNGEKTIQMVLKSVR